MDFFCLFFSFLFSGIMGMHGIKKGKVKNSDCMCMSVWQKLVMCNNKSIWTKAKFIKTGNERGIKYWYIKLKHYCIIRHDGSLMKIQWNLVFVKQCTGCLMIQISLDLSQLWLNWQRLGREFHFKLPATSDLSRERILEVHINDSSWDDYEFVLQSNSWGICGTRSQLLFH